jgi:hypothetical protein
MKAYVVITPFRTYGESKDGRPFSFEGSPSDFLNIIGTYKSTVAELKTADIRVRAGVDDRR